MPLEEAPLLPPPDEEPEAPSGAGAIDEVLPASGLLLSLGLQLHEANARTDEAPTTLAGVHKSIAGR